MIIKLKIKNYHLLKKKKLVNINAITDDEYFEIENSEGGDIIEIYLYGQKLKKIILKSFN